MSNITATNMILATLGVGGVGAALWTHHKLATERKIRATVEGELARLAALRSPEPCLPAPTPAPRLPAPRNVDSGDASTVQALRPAPRTFDDVFAAYGQGLPVPFLRALALHESDMSPRLCSGPAWGLLQVIEVVRQDFNQRAGMRYTRQDLLDPAVNVTIAATTLSLIIKSYATNHPHVPNLRADWRNPQFVALVAFGWNAGFSERAGVGRVATYLEQRGAEVTINDVHRVAREAGASKHLANPRKVAWAKMVTRQYFRELADEAKPVVVPREIDMSDDVGGRPVVAGGPDPGYATPVHAEPVYVTPVHVEPVYPVHVEPVYPGHAPAHEGPITSPSQVDHPIVIAGPITSPSQVEQPPSSLHPIEIATAPAGSPVQPGVAGWPIDPYASATLPPRATQPSGGSGPVDPYASQCSAQCPGAAHA